MYQKYQRTIPRDLFNEASLLKCLGRLYICLETAPGQALLGSDDVGVFDIGMDMSCGSISVKNILFTIHGVGYTLARPLNSRESWPLYVVAKDDDPDFEEVAVFDERGDLSHEMLTLIGA